MTEDFPRSRCPRYAVVLGIPGEIVLELYEDEDRERAVEHVERLRTAVPTLRPRLVDRSLSSSDMD